MWVVFEQGVNRHRIVALCDSLGGAEDRAAEESVKMVPKRDNYQPYCPGDGYHDYVVGTLPVNELVNDCVVICWYNKGVKSTAPTAVNNFIIKK